MTLVTLALVAVAGAIVGAALAWIAARRGRASEAASVAVDAVPLSASVDAIARGLEALFAERTGLQLLGFYAARDGTDALDARWRAAGDAPILPLHAPATILLQIGRAQLVDVEELGRGLRPGLPPGDPAAVASQVEAERAAEAVAATDAFSENPFELDDNALTDHAAPRSSLPGEPVAPQAVDATALAARVVALPWYGPFGWQGLVVARPAGDASERDLEWLERAAVPLGERLGVHCEAAERTRLADAPPGEVTTEAPQPATVYVAGAAPVEEDPGAARLRKAEARLAEALIAPRRAGDLIRATVALLSDGLAPDRCYAVEVESLHTRPVEHERRTEAAAPATGLDFGSEFLAAVRARSAPTITAILLDAAEAASMVPAEARDRLGPVSRMLVPVKEKASIVVVFVAEWIDSAKHWNPADVAFAERVAARSATARERLLQFDALGEQAALARAESERLEAALGHLEALLAAVPDALVGLDGDGAIAFANRAAATLLGRRELELMGRWIGEATADLDGDAATWERVLTTTSVQRFAGALVAPNGPVDVTVVPSLASPICERLVVFAPSAPTSEAAPPGESPNADAVRSVAEPIGRLLGHLDLIAGGAHGELTPSQDEAFGVAQRLGAELRARLNVLLRSLPR